MKFSKVIITMAALALLAGAAIAQQAGQQPPPKPAPAPGQQPPAQTPPPGTAPAPPATPAAPPVNEKEEADYKMFFTTPAADSKLLTERGEAFLKEFPESRYNETVYSKLANAYLALNQVDKMTVAGEKALELNPNNVDVLALLAYAIPRRADPGQLDFQQKIQKAERYAKQTIEVLNALTKPEQMTEEDFVKAKNQKISLARSGLGVVYFHLRRYPEMVTEMEQVIALSQESDPVDYYLMGIAYQNSKRYSDAATAYEKCAAMPGQMQAECGARASAVKKVAATSANPPNPPKP